MRRAKVKHVMSAVSQLHNPRGVTQSDIQDLLRETYGREAPLDCKLALKAAVNEGFLAVKHRRFFPTTNSATSSFIDMKRGRRKRAKKSRRSRRGRSRQSDMTDFLMARRRRRSSTARRRRRRGRKHDNLGDDVDARRRRKRSSSRRRSGKSSTGRKRRRGRKHDEGVEKEVNKDGMQTAEEPEVKQGEDVAQ